MQYVLDYREHNLKAMPVCYTTYIFYYKGNKNFYISRGWGDTSDSTPSPSQMENHFHLVPFS